MAVLAVLFLSAILSLPASWLPRIERLACPSFSQVALGVRYGTSSCLQPHGCHFAPARQLAGPLVSMPVTLTLTARPLIFNQSGATPYQLTSSLARWHTPSC